MMINYNVPMAEQLAAWKFIEYMTSPSVQLFCLEQSKDPDVGTRPASLQYAIQHASTLGVPADFLKAIDYATEHIDPNPLPPSPVFGQTQADLFVILSQLETKQITQAQALTDLQQRMTMTLQEAGLLKS